METPRKIPSQVKTYVTSGRPKAVWMAAGIAKRPPVASQSPQLHTYFGIPAQTGDAGRIHTSSKQHYHKMATTLETYNGIQGRGARTASGHRPLALTNACLGTLHLKKNGVVSALIPSYT